MSVRQNVCVCIHHYKYMIKYDYLRTLNNNRGSVSSRKFLHLKAESNLQRKGILLYAPL